MKQMELDRVVPVIERIAALLRVAISIDTSKPAVMAAAAAAGACIVNDVQALRAPGARAWAAASGVGVCLMHMQGEPRTMQEHPRYHDVRGRGGADSCTRERAACLEAGIAPAAIALDPGFGFGKGHEHNLALLEHLAHLAALGLAAAGRRLAQEPDRARARPAAARAALRRPRARGLGGGVGASVMRTHELRPRGMRCAW